jgi:acyl-CoA dehydrogenase
VSDDLEAVEEAIADVLTDLCTPERLAEHGEALDRRLWSTLASAGYTRIGLPERVGGSGGTLAEAAVVLRLAGEHGTAAPIAEAWLGGHLLAAGGLTLPDGVLTIGRDPLTATPDGDGWRISGSLRRVAYGRDADVVAGLAHSPDHMIVFVAPVDAGAGARAATVMRRGTNLAREPRDDLRLDLTLGPDRAARLPGRDPDAELLARARLASALMIAGAAQRALDLTVRHIGQRRQFGRALAAFQAVQQLLATAAGETAAARSAAEGAVRVGAGGFGDTEARLSAAAAKTRASSAATVVASVAHQLHGAIGITEEYALRFATTRLWSGRDEWPSGSQSAEDLSAGALAAAEHGLWPLLVAL